MSNKKYQVSMYKYDAVVFDLDGVVTRTEHIHAAAWKDLFDEYLKKRSQDETFKPFDSGADYCKYVDGKPRYEGVKSFLASRGIEVAYGNADDSTDEETVCGLGNRKNRLFLKRLKSEEVQVFESTIDLIGQLRKRGFKTAIVSSSKNCADILDRANITGLFDAKVDGMDSEGLDLTGKPEPDIFLESARRLNVKPKRCVIIEDAVSGVQAGSKGGFGLVIGVNRGGQEKALKEAGADLVVGDLSEINIAAEIKDLPHALNAFEEIREQIGGKEVVVFLDYDGTLTPIVSRPEDAILSEDMRKTLAILSGQCPLAIISGRGLKDIKERVGIKNIYYAGSHGFEIKGPKGLKMEHEEARKLLPVFDEAEEDLKQQLTDIDGAQVERKKFTIAVHYRNVRDEHAGSVEEVVDHAADHYSGLRKAEGKKVYELRPDIDWDKGKAISWLLDTLNFVGPGIFPFYIGDDITDEDAFEALAGQGIGIVVGENSRTTEAVFRLKSPDQVRMFLRKLKPALEHGNAWSLTYEGFDPEEEGLREALCTLGNGYFATRGAGPEADADDVHYPGTYLAGGYNRLKTKIAGRTIENEDLVNMPNWLCLNFRIPGKEWFDLKAVDILFYRQHLDIKRGVLHRTVRFRDEKGRETRLLQCRLVHIGDKHVAALETVITPLNWAGELEIRSALDGRVTNSGVERYESLSNKHLEPVESRRIDENSMLLKVRTSQSGLHVAMGARTEISWDGKPLAIKRTVVEKPAYIAQLFTVELTKGAGVTIEKTVSLFTSRDPAISECTLEAEKAITDAGSFSSLLGSHVLAWRHLWRRFDVKGGLNVSSDDHHIQRNIRLYSFHILQSSSIHSVDIDVGIPSRGWHGEAYRGHIFWDELIIFPFLNYRAPQITRSLLMYRYRRLKEARRAARKLGYKGAMYPWQSASNGREETQQVHLNPRSGRWIQDNSRLQRHINVAIVYNICQYWQTSGDLEFLSFYGGEMILEIARFWASIATYNQELDRYEIRGIMGPDEYHDSYPGADKPGLNNNAYTNIMVTFVMNRALDLPHILPEEQFIQLRQKLDIKETEMEKWKEMSRKMRLTFHDDGIISQFEGYDRLEEFDWEGYLKRYGNVQRLDRILEAENDTPNRYKVSKQADVLMLFYLFSAEELNKLFNQLGYPFEYETIPKNIDYYLKRTSNGSSLSWIVHSWVAVRRDRERSWELFNQALKTDVADIQGGTTPEGVHLGAMAGCVDMLQRGYTGLETHGDVLRLNPSFPREIKQVHFHLRYRGHWLDLDISSDRLKITALSGRARPIRIWVKDRVFKLKEGETGEVML
jgi:alpha,alpha-trehalase